MPASTQAGASLAARRRRRNPQAAPNDSAASAPPHPQIPLPRNRRGRVMSTLRKTDRFHPTQRDREASNRDSPPEKEVPPPAERSLYQRVPPVSGRHPRSPPNIKRISRFPATHRACSTKGRSRRAPIVASAAPFIVRLLHVDYFFSHLSGKIQEPAMSCNIGLASR